MNWFQATYLFLLEQVSWKELPKLRWRWLEMWGFFPAENSKSEDVNLMTVNVGLGVVKPQQDCMVRQNFVPREAQRLQHGSIRVLKDLTGYHIKGLLGGNSLRKDVTKKGSFSEKLGKLSQQKTTDLKGLKRVVFPRQWPGLVKGFDNSEGFFQFLGSQNPRGFVWWMPYRARMVGCCTVIV